MSQEITVAGEFEKWFRMTQSPAVGAAQLTEVRRAFYSGYFCALGDLLLLTEGAESAESESLAADGLGRLYKECEEFFFDVKGGRA